MRYLILSDIHANLHALDAVLSDAERIGFDAALVLGDLVGYGGDPAAVLDRIADLGPAAMIRGNHDKVCAGLESAALFNDAARVSAEWTFAVLSPAHRHVLAQLPQGPLVVEPGLMICHGAPFDEDYYIFDANDAGRALGGTPDTRLCFFGHTHLPAIFNTAEDPVRLDPDLGAEELRLPALAPALINVGSVGQPRDGDPRAAYGLLDTARNSLQMRRVVYDVAGAQARIIAEGLPRFLALRLERGQ